MCGSATTGVEICWGAYGCVDRLGITQFLNRRNFPPRETVERVTYYLDDAHPDWRKQTRDCYFGHTHVPFSNYLHDGIRFHNSGCGLRRMQFNPIFF